MNKNSIYLGTAVAAGFIVYGVYLLGGEPLMIALLLHQMMWKSLIGK